MAPFLPNGNGDETLQEDATRVSSTGGSASRTLKKEASTGLTDAFRWAHF